MSKNWDLIGKCRTEGWKRRRTSRSSYWWSWEYSWTVSTLIAILLGWRWKNTADKNPFKGMYASWIYLGSYRQGTSLLKLLQWYRHGVIHSAPNTLASIQSGHQGVGINYRYGPFSIPYVIYMKSTPDTHDDPYRRKIQYKWMYSEQQGSTQTR